MQHRRPALIGALFLGLCPPLLAQDRYEPKPLPAGPDVPTAQKSLERHIAFYREMYSKACAVEPAWQPHLGALLDLSSKVLVGVARDDEEKVRAEIACDRLRELDCRDPVVRLMMADACRLRERFDDAQQHLQVAQEVFEDRPPVGLLAFVAILVESNLLWDSGREQHYHQHWPALGRALPELVRAPEFDGGNERWLAPLLEMVAKPDDPKSERILGDLEKVAGRPVYSLLVVRAKHHVKMAWKARGKKAAREVGEDNFQIFGEHLEKAAEAATAAYELCPQHPEAPSTMISVLGPIGGQNDEMRMWLDRTVAAEFDHTEAYGFYLHYLQPRWGGSHRLQVQFGLECLRTGRFDTNVPNNYRLAIHHIAKDGSNFRREWQKDSVQKRLAELDAGYMAATNEPSLRSHYTTHQLYALCLADKAAEAAALYEQRGLPVRDELASSYRVSNRWIWKQMIPHLKNYQLPTVERRDVFAGFQEAPHPHGAPTQSLREVLDSASISAPFAAAWFEQCFVSAYDRAGTHDPKWDDDARELMREFAETLERQVLLRAPTVARIARLTEARCRDPLTLYVLDRMQGGKDIGARLSRLADLQMQIEKSHGPVFGWWITTHVRSLLAEAKEPSVPELERMELDRAVAAATDPVFAGDNRPRYVRLLSNGLDRLGTPMPAELVQRLASQPDVDPWILLMVTGLHHAGRARDGKLEDPARRTALQQAADRLGKAHALCPRFAEAATAMIRVAAELSDDASPSPRLWLERAVAVNAGSTTPFFAFLDLLRPESGGSPLAMYRFGVECLQTERFDTVAPFTFFRAVALAQKELPDRRACWAATGVIEQLDHLFAGYLSQERPVFSVEELQTLRCAAAWAGGRYDQALQAWRDNGETLLQNSFPVLDSEDAELVEVILRTYAKRNRR